MTTTQRRPTPSVERRPAPALPSAPVFTADSDNPPHSRLLLTLNAWRATRLGRLLRLGKVARAYGILLGCEIFENCPRSTVLRHPTGIVIHRHARVGDRVVIMQGVTVGKQGHRGPPVIEDEVYLGAGAKVIGDVRVGRGARIGANAIVTRDVPAGHTIVGANEDLTVRRRGRRRPA